MKKIILTLTLATVFMYNSMAGGGYEKAIGQNIGSIFTTENVADYDGVANKFVRIGEAEKDKWLPYYYASLTYIFKSFRLTTIEDKDQALIQAQQMLDKSATLSESNSEIEALQGFLYMMSLSVDPSNRGQTMSPKAFGAYEKALALEPGNPRALLFKGQMMYGMAQFFGSGTEDACALVNKSMEIFEKEAGNQTIEPSWGIYSAKEYISKCNAPANEADEKE